MAKKRGPKQMTEDHKAALAEGRRQGRAVKNYLEALEASKPKRGRKRTPESIERKLAEIEASIDDASPVERLQMAQERLDLQHELESMDQAVDLSGLEAEFVKVAKAYGERKGITYAAWREVGVAASTLKEAGITRGRS